MSSKYNWDEYLNGKTWTLRGRFAHEPRIKAPNRVDCGISMFQTMLGRKAAEAGKLVEVLDIDIQKNTITFRVHDRPDSDEYVVGSKAFWEHSL